MKRLALTIKKLFIQLLNWRKVKTKKRIEKKLKKAVVKKEVERTVLKGKIIDYIEKRYPRNSKYIIKNLPNNNHVINEINEKFGSEMHKHNLELNNELKFI